MKKFTALLISITLLFVIWACTDLDHSNPFDPEWGDVTVLNSLDLQIEKVDRIKVIWDSDYFNKEGYTFQVDRKLGTGEWQEKYKVFQKDIYFFTDSIAGINQLNTYRVRVGYDENLSAGVEASVNNIFPAPTNINLSRIDLKTIQLRWSDNSNGEDGFIIDRYSDGAWDESYYLVIPNTTAWTDTTAALNDSIQYRIYAYRKTVNSDCVETERIENKIPAPTSLIIKQNDVSTFELNWTDNSNGEDGYIVQRSIDGASFATIDSLAENSISYVDPSLGKGKSLSDVSYRVMSFSGDYTSDYAETSSQIEFPAPSAVGFEKLSVSSVRIYWTDNSISEDGFVIDKKVGADEWVLNYASVSTDVTNWTDTNAEINEPLQYRIYAYKGINTTTTADSPVITNTFPAPSALTYTKLFIYSIKLDWADNSNGEEGFVIDRSVNGTWTNGYVTLPANTITYADSNVPLNSTIQYRIHAYKGTDVSSQITSSVINNNIPAPSNPVLSQLAVNIVRIDWTDNCAGEDGYKIDRKDNTGTWTNGFAVLAEDTHTWNDSTAVVSDSLQYRIYAYKGTSNSASVTAYASDLTFPPPTNVQFANINLNTITLNWNDNSIGETGYKIDRQVDGGAWATVIGTAAADTTTWSDTNAPINSEVQYRVYAYTPTDQSSYGYSELINNAIPSPLLDSVTQLSVSSFKLDWTDNSIGEDGFKIERKIDDGTYTQIAAPVANSVTYTDSSIDKKGYNTVYYRIKAYKSTFDSDYSENSQTVSFPAPSDIGYTKVSVNSINVTWTDNSTGEDGFKIDKKVGALAWVIGYGNAAADAVSWLDTNAEPNTSIQYKIYAYKGSNTSASELSVVIDNTFPAPTNISYQKLNLSSIKLNWTDNSTGETGFIIDRKVGVNSWTAYDSTSANAIAWTDTSSPVNETLQFRVRAYKDTYTSVNLESVAINNTIPAPSNLTADVNGMSITLNWTDNSTGEEGFKIDRMTSDSVWVESYASVGSNIVTWNETVPDTGKYSFRIRTFKSSFSSQPSSSANIIATQIDNPMILVPAGTFQMGQAGAGEPVHQVTISHSFYLAKYETTQKEWSDVMSTNPASGFGVGDNYPVYAVSWYDALVYCNKKSLADGYNPCYVINESTNPNDWGIVPTFQSPTWDAVECRWHENGYRMPTEAEWEFAARYNDERSYPWGETPPSSTLCNYNSFVGETTEVGSYTAGNSALGFSDMSGNVWEWVWDWYASYSISAQTDPTGPTEVQTYRVFRSGCYGSTYDFILCAGRYGYFSYGRNNPGFRVARNNPADPRPVTFIKSYPEGTADHTSVHKILKDGSVIETGYNPYQEYWESKLLKVDSEGNKLWSNSIIIESSGKLLCLDETKDGGFILGSSSVIIKTDSQGNETWTKGLGCGLVNSILVTEDNGYILCAANNISGTDYGVILKTDSLGNEEWRENFADFDFRDIKIIDDGYLITGYTISASDTKAYLLKTNFSGIETWSKYYKVDQPTFGLNTSITSDNGYIITGSSGSSPIKGLLIKTDSSGNQEWIKTYDGIYSSSVLKSVKQDGNYFISSGYSHKNTTPNDTQLWLLKTDSQGNVIFNKDFGETDLQDWGSSVSVSEDGGYYINGGILSPIERCSMMLIKTDENGNVMGYTK